MVDSSSSSPATMASRFAIATLSLGNCEFHSLEDKLKAAARAGFTSVELFVADWERYVSLWMEKERGISASSSSSSSTVSSIHYEHHFAAARQLRDLLDSLNLRINVLQPIRNIEGLLDQQERRQRFKEMKEYYYPLCNILDIDLILCCSSIETPDRSTGDVATISKDLVELADTAKEWQRDNGGKLIRIAYEGLSWGTHVNTWKQAWRCVSYQSRSNLGLIIDSFNSLGREYCDPYNANGSGLQRSVSASAAFLTAHLQELARTVPGNKVFLFQIADARRPTPGTSFAKPPSDPTVPRLQPWSRNFRLFPLEHDRGAYLPVDQYAQTLLKMGYQGDLSLEVFNASLSDKADSVPQDHADRGYKALQKLVKAVDDLNAAGSSSTTIPTQSPVAITTVLQNTTNMARSASNNSIPSSEKLTLASSLDDLLALKTSQLKEGTINLVRPTTPNSPRLGKRIPLAEI